MTTNIIDGGDIPSWRKRYNDRLASGQKVPVARRDLGIIDPWEGIGFNAPTYPAGMLPKVFEDYVQDNIAEYGGDPAAYAAAFLSMHCGVLHSTVEMQTRLAMDNWKAPNDHCLILGKTGAKKSGMFNDLTKHQDQWQNALSKGTPAIRRKGVNPPAIYMQAGSIEGVLIQIADNKGERLMLGNDEAMTFFQGAGSHHQADGASLMSDAVCRIYDGKSFRKRLVKAAYEIPRCLGTMLMTTVFNKFSGWESFSSLVESGMMSRFTVGLISNPMERDPRMHIKDADKAMLTQLTKLRAMRDTRFALTEEASEAWSEYINERERLNVALEDSGSAWGLSEWIRKYDMRIISLATVFQAYEFVDAPMDFEPFDIPKTAQDDDKVGGGEARQGKLVRISIDNLSRAVDFVEGFLYETQKYFYTAAQGQTEFGKELKHWVARRITIEDPDDPVNLIVTRNVLLNTQGPMNIRANGAITPTIRDKQRRFVRILLDHGFIEPCTERPDGKKVYKQGGLPEDATVYMIRKELFQFYESRREEMRAYDADEQGKLARLRDRLPLRLKKKAPPEGEA